MKTLTQIPLGTQVLFGKAAKQRRRIERTIFSVFEAWSYQEIIPPIFDYYDVFTKGMGLELEDTLYRFIDREGNILALRPEFTSLVAKSVATRLADHPKPLRLCYCGEVLRYETPRGGRQREFFQIGLENIGGEHIRSDAEVILVAIESLKKLGIKKFQINLGEIGYFAGIVERIDFSREDLLKIYGPGLGIGIGGGGRYDNLLKNFGCDFPSVGFSFSLERLMSLES